MKVIVVSKIPFDVVTLTNVSSIAFSNGVYTITTGTGTLTYSSDKYIVNII